MVQITKLEKQTNKVHTKASPIQGIFEIPFGTITQIEVKDNQILHTNYCAN